LVDTIVPALAEIDPSRPDEELWRNAVEANVRWAVRQLAATPAGENFRSGSLQLVGAIYELATGRVRFLEDNK